ncbi:UBX domain-containing protein 4 [Octopus bimaculoides]|uniref:UBX domain-containing protein 4 n=1 Tax=Octopus bimaculoides TaxID=37653 RepID=A0A0L8FYJ2_OCTBM|nr:UBX domain-containing protein 4 [Octopus bimaculoides]|eukprot:XP_014785712.1 PREDICTED: UBX domain-containing protein 4-like [Octopus bimaculoides]
MLWYEDSIAKAIQVSKDRKCIFLVYVSGEDELSKKMDETLAHEAVSDACKDFVAVKIKSPSDICQQFSQIYPVVFVPSVFFIGLNGLPIEITPGHLGPEEFNKKAQDVIKIHESQLSGAANMDVDKTRAAAAAPVAAAAATPTTSAVTPEPERLNAAPESMELEHTDQPAAESLVAPSAEVPSTSAAPDSSASNSLDQRVMYAKEKIQENQEIKQVNEGKKEKEKEINRRQLGKDVQKLRRGQVDRSLKEMQDEIKKEREEDRRARQRIKEEIDRDRAQRKAKYEQEKVERELMQKEMREKKMQENQMTAAEREAARKEISRLQFRLPDGSAITQQFKSSEPLSVACSFISQHTGSNIQLYTMFPKRTFTAQDMNSSLLSLELVPSAVILVIPVKSVLAPKKYSNNFLGMILAPLFTLLNFIYGIIFGTPTNANPGDSRTTKKDNESTVPSSTTSQRPSTAYKRRSSPISRQEGNIHKFTSSQDDDDEQSTWNGNSTQQM